MLNFFQFTQTGFFLADIRTKKKKKLCEKIIIDVTNKLCSTAIGEKHLKATSKESSNRNERNIL